MNRKAFAVACVSLVAMATTVNGHDYWLAPSSTSTTKGAAVDVRLYRGEPLEIDDERPLEIERTVRFHLLAGGKQQDLIKSATDGQTPVTRVTPQVNGGNLIVMERKAQLNRLEGEKFTEYLKEEGLDAIIARRKELGESKAEGTELYSRYLKALIQVGGKHDDTYGKPVGQLLEILPEADPSTRKLGDRLPVRILFDGKPLKGAQVIADVSDQGKLHTQKLTTDADGRASFKVEHKGFWLVRLVHMRRVARGGEADWESFWGAYSFGL